MGARRRSKQQALIYQYLCASQEHPTAEMVFQGLRPVLPGLSLGTVYRNLSRLCEEGLAQRLTFPVERFDHDTSSHPHFACRKCGRVTDLMMRNAQPEEEAEARRCGYQVERCEVVYYGVCPDCVSREASLS